MTTNDTRKAKSKLAVLSSSLEELEAHLDPLFSQTFPETLLALEPIQQAKLQTVIPYVVYDLMFIYLKSRGIDPKTHPVFAELDRVRQYFDKIKNAENPPTRTTQVDKAAASRFIKHAITQAQIDSDAAQASSTSLGPINPTLQRALSDIDRKGSLLQNDNKNPTSEDAESSKKSRFTPLPVKMTKKMVERAEYEKRIREAGSEEDDELVIHDQGEGLGENGDVALNYGHDVEMGVEDEEEELKAAKGKGKKKAEEDVQENTAIKTGSKRRRPVMDPFAASGYGDPKDSESDHPPTKKQTLDPSSTSTSLPASATSTPGFSQSKMSKKKKGKKTAETDVDPSIEIAAAIDASMVESATAESQAAVPSASTTPSAGPERRSKRKGKAAADTDVNVISSSSTPKAGAKKTKSTKAKKKGAAST